MIGFQDLIIKRNIKVTELAKEINTHPTCIYDWFRNNRVPKHRLKVLAEKFNVTEEYLNEKVNDINTYQPKKFGFCNEYNINGDVTEIILNRKNKENLITYVDTGDLKKLIKFNRTWSASYSKYTNSYYAHVTLFIGKINEKRKYTKISLQTFLVSSEQNEDIYIDHVNHNTLDNRKDNLRIITCDKNLRNRKGRNKNNKSGYRNVSKRGKWWVVQLQIDRKNTTLKKFPLDQLEEAGKFAEEMRKKYYGEFSGES